MKSIILIACILSDGDHISPRGEYQTFKRCNELVLRFETETYPSYAGKSPICWCYRAPPPMPVKVKRRADWDRKSPAP